MKNKLAYLYLRWTAKLCLLFLCALVFTRAEASYLPTTGSNIGIGTSTPVGAFTVLSGNVGLGTFAPTSALQVVGTVAATSFSGNGSALTNLPAVGGWADGGTNVYTSTTTDNVGIGTTTPNASTLEVVKNANQSVLKLSSAAGGNGDYLNVNSAGNVGVGTFAPIFHLVVVEPGTVAEASATLSTAAQLGSTIAVQGNGQAFFMGRDSTNNIEFLMGTSAFGYAMAGAVTSHEFRLRTANIDRMTFTSSGVVGIGTVNPMGGFLVVENTGTDNSFRVNDAAVDSSPFVIDAGGNVGIGTTTVNALFDISSTAAQNLVRVNDNGAGDTTAFVIDQDGNVGIGTALANNSALAVNGNLYSAGAVGIGTFTPTGNLDVRGDEARIWTGAGTNTNATSAGELYVEGDLEVDGTIYGDGSGITSLSSALPAGGWSDGGTNIYATTTTDNVGIGTTTPNAATLEIVKNAAQPALKVSSSATGGGDYMVIKSDGNMGIGTTAPRGALSVMNGNVGIGTTSPVSNLEVSGGNIGLNGTASHLDPSLYISASGIGQGNGLQIQNQNSTGLSIIQTGRSMVFGIDTLSSGNRSFTFNSAGTSKVTITGVGNVGIGTLNPLSKLVVNGGVGIGTLGQSSFLDTAAPVGGLIVERNVGIGTTTPVGGLTVMNGNVGIGTWSPTSALQVVGTVAATAFSGDGSALTNLPAGGGWTDGGSNVYTSTTTDNVGIGTTTPNAATLEVVKNAAQPAFKISSSATGDGDFFVVNSQGNVGIGTVAPRGALTIMSGNVGIGSTSPQSNLDVAGNIFLSGGSRTIFQGTSSNLQLGWTSGGGVYLVSGSAAGADVTVQPSGTNAFIYKPGGTEKVRFDSNGNVGIATFDPVSRLVVNGGVGIGTLGQSSFLATAAPVGGLIVERNVGIGTTAPVGGLTVMNGNVGVGTWSPTSKLQVVGTVTATAFSGDGSALTNLPAGGGWTDGGPNVYTSTTTDNVGVGTTTPNAATLEVVKNAAQPALKVSSSATGGGDYFVVNSQGNIGIGTVAPVGGLVIMNGNVGIGTFSPEAALEVSGTARSSVYMQTQSGSNTVTMSAINSSPRVMFGTTADLTSSMVLGNYNGANNIDVKSADLRIYSTTSAVPGIYYSNSSGNVGIGTLNPLAALSVYGNVGIGTNAPVGAFAVMNGNVGIGTWSPIGQLEVRGGSAATRIWIGAGTDTNATAAGELYVEGDLEVDGTIYGDASGLTGASQLTAAGGWTDSGTNVYTSTTTDNVGIGTTTPNAATLEVVKNANQPAFKVSSAATGNGDYLVINSQGRIGIGTAKPGSYTVLGTTPQLELQNPSSSTLFNINTSLSGHDSAISFSGLGVPKWTFSSRNDADSPNDRFSTYDPTFREVITYLSGGNVGIGTNAPVGAFAVMNGNVGIGTWSPIGQLEVRGGSAAARIWTGAGTDTNATAAGELYVEGDLEVDGTIYGDASGLTGASQLSAAGGWTDGGTNVYTSTATDLVAIGTTTPVSTLTIKGNIGIGTTTPYLTIPASTNGMIIEGNVGIGTFSASLSKLMVFGSGNFSNSAAFGTFSTPLAKVDIKGGGASSSFSLRQRDINDVVRFVLLDSGNVGIGTQAPVGALAVMSGNVGIGTWSPIGSLEVKGDSATRIWTGAGTDTNATAAGELYVQGDLEVDGTIYGDASGLTGTSQLTAAGGWTDGGTNVYTSVTTDNVGIGTTTPNAATLEIVKNAAQPALKVSSSSTGSGDFFMVNSQGNIGIGTIAPRGALTVINGNVGIGTTNPAALLELSNGTDATRFSMGATGSLTMTTSNASGSISINPDNTLSLGTGATDSIQIGRAAVASFPITFTTLTGETMRVMDGNVGIGTAKPFNKLAVNGGVAIGTASSSNFLDTLAPPGGLLVERNVGIGTTTPVGGLTVMNGNVGIGTWSPTQKLEVIGTVKATAFSGDGSGLTNIAAGGWTDGGTNIYTSTTTDLVAIGTTTPASALTVKGNVGIGTTTPYRTIAAPANGMIVEGPVGIGTFSPMTPFHIDSQVTTLGGNVHAIAYFGSFLNNKFLYLGYDPLSQAAILGADAVSVTTDISVRPYSASDGAVERMRILGDGTVGIGTSMPVNGTAVMNGNVGIGTWSPTQKLEVIGTVKATAFSGDGSALTNLPSGGGWTDGGTNVYTSTTTDNVGIGTTTPTAALLVENAGTQDSFRVNDAVVDPSPFIINSTGNVGIGTSTPRAAVTIMSGNVGIGTLNPTGQLETNGEIRISTDSSNTDVTVPNASTAKLTIRNTNSNDNVLSTIVFDEDSDSPVAAIAAQTIDNSGPYGQLLFWTRGVSGFNTNPKMILDPDGKLGLGTTLPAAGLSVMNGNVGIGTWSAANRLAIKGNIGVGTTLPYLRISAPNNGMVVEGNVGIGTWQPISKLDVRESIENVTTFLGTAGDAGKDTTITLGSAAGGTGEKYITYQNADTGSNGWLVGMDDDETFRWFYGTTGEITDPTRMILTQSGNLGIGTLTPVAGLSVMNGNVGIGTWSPTQKLQVVGTVTATAFSGDGSALTNLPATGGWTDGGTNVYTSTTTDNVGIGTTTPNAATLEIVKNAAQPVLKVSSTATAGGDFLMVTSQGNIGIGTIAPRAGLSILNGFVGIGTTNPLNNFEVFGNSDVAERIISNTNAGVTLGFVRPTQRTWNIGMSSSSPVANAFTIDDANITGFEFMIVPGGNVGIGTTMPVGGLAVMNGNVGIGTWSATQKLQVVGTVAATAFSGDGSGLTNIAAGGWADGGTNVYTSTTTDNVGIGTTTPGAKLEIADDGDIDVLINATLSDPDLTYAVAGVNTWNLFVDRSNSSFHFEKSGLTLNAVVFDSTGNVGIGTELTSATAKLSVLGNVGIGTTIPVAGLSVMNGNVGIGTWSPINKLGIKGNIGIGTTLPYLQISAPNNGMVVEGNVGIGTWNPSSKLQVVGTVTATAFSGDGSALTGIAAGGWTDGGTNVYTSTTTDNVGIGTTTPTAALLVQNAGTQDSFRVNDQVADSSPFIIDAAGNIGIGTTTADALVDIVGGNVFVDDVIYAGNDIRFIGTAAPQIYNDENGAGDNLVITGARGTGSFLTLKSTKAVGTSDYINFRVGNDGATEAMRIVTTGNIGVGTATPVGGLTVMNGNVGIGTWSPTQKLQVVGTVAATAFSGDGSGLTGIAAGGWTDGGTNVYTSTTTDNVGIGTTTPNAATLEIVKNAAQPALKISSSATGAGDYLVVNSMGNVGLGTTAPRGALIVMNGNVGIGTTNPYYPLMLMGSSTSAYYGGSLAGGNGEFKIGVSNAGYVEFGSLGGTPLRLIEGSVDRLFITGGNIGIGTSSPAGGLTVMNGNVGIGTWSPSSALEVKSTTNAQITINGASGGCLMFRDTDNAGWTECNALNGMLTCSVDADGICDGS